MKNKELDWRIWNKDDSVEERTYSRASGELPEMESAKQLREIMPSHTKLSHKINVDFLVLAFH